jgi:FkbM family methyltransferase
MGLLGTLRFLAEHPLTADRRVRTLARFLRWQLASRLAPGPIAVDFVASARLLVSRGMTGATGNIYVGLHEFEDMAFLLHLLRPTDLFVDVGANVGSYTILAAAVVGAHCIALEPGPKAFERLEDNVRLNGADTRVQAYQIGAGDRRGQLQFTLGLDTVNHVVDSTSSEAGEPAVTVDVVPLDELLQGASPVTLIKLDVEGFEAKVLEGAEQTLERPELKAVIMETKARVPAMGSMMRGCTRACGGIGSPLTATRRLSVA